MEAAEGMWNQGGNMEIPCWYEVSTTREKKERKEDMKKRSK